MYIRKFIDREREYKRLTEALRREKPQFLVLYGRRRIGKSTLIKEVLKTQEQSIYFLADRTNEANQRRLFSQSVATEIPDFDKVLYGDWESLLRALNRQLDHRVVVCMDEFPYLVKNSPSLPSVIQKLLNERTLRFDLIICGSAQQQMHDIVLNKKEPLYGQADEIMLIRAIPARYTRQALECTAEESVTEYAVWGGVPRYWEIRKDYPSLMEAITAQILDPNGFLMDEPQRLLRDDMRDSVQPETILSIIGNGANRMSEIASRAGREASQLTEPLARLRELGYLEREIPYGENEKKSKRGVYHVSDPLFRFLFRFVVPYRSILQLGRMNAVESLIETNMTQYVGEWWEKICRDYVSGNVIDGVAYNLAGRWWGKIFPEDKIGRVVELDIVAESLDHKHVIIGECKWTEREDARHLMSRLQGITPYLPFIKRGQRVHYLLFLKRAPTGAEQCQGRVLLPEDVM